MLRGLITECKFSGAALIEMAGLVFIVIPPIILVSQRKRVEAISLHHLRTLDHIGPSNCSTAMAAASLLGVARQQDDSGQEEVTAITEESRGHLLRIHSEIKSVASSEESEEQFDNLRRILKDLLDQ